MGRQVKSAGSPKKERQETTEDVVLHIQPSGIAANRTLGDLYGTADTYRQQNDHHHLRHPPQGCQAWPSAQQQQRPNGEGRDVPQIPGALEGTRMHQIRSADKQQNGADDGKENQKRLP